MQESAVSINPLNWKRDDTYAGVEENLESLVWDEEMGKYESKDGIADAQLDTERGVVICTTTKAYADGEEFFGIASLHNGDYPLDYANIQKNVADHISSYLKNN